MAARNSAGIIREIWDEWVCQGTDRSGPIGEALVKKFLKEPGAPKDLQAQTVMGWLGAKKVKNGVPTRVPQADSRPAALALFCPHHDKPDAKNHHRDLARATALKAAWAEDEKLARSSKLPQESSKPVPPDPSATWMPEESLKKSGDQALLCDLDIHKSQPTDPQKPCLSVTLTCGEVLGRLDGEGGLPDLRYRLTVRKLEIQPTLENAQLVPGSIAKRKPLRFTTRWHIDIKAKSNELPLEGQRLADVQVLRPDDPVRIGLTVYCNDNDFVPEFIAPPPDYPDKELRVLEHVLKKWNLDPRTVRVPLAEGRLLAPKPTKK